jgi:hypothetical protein
MNAEAVKQDALNAALVEEENTRNRIWNIIKGSMADYETAVTKITTKVEKHILKDFETSEASRRDYLQRQSAGKQSALPATPIQNIPTPATGFQHGGIVTKPTRALVGEAGPEAITPLSGISPRAASRNLAHTRSIGENTKQLRSLNDQLDRILGGASQSNISRYAAGMGGTGAAQRPKSSLMC